MDSNNSSNINRSDSLRKSVRLNSARKGIAPAPPVNVIDKLNLDTEVELRRPSAAISAPVPVERSTILPKVSLSSITRPERSAISMRIVENKQKTAVAASAAVSAHDMLDEEDDANVSFALGSIEKHINQVEESFKHKHHNDESQQASIDELQVELIRKSKRYMETENLLHPVGSEMASENDFQYLGGGEDLETDVNLKPQEFQRNSDVRSSMGASYTASGKMAASNMTQRPKIARTASDTKNTDVLAMRAMIKQKQQILPQQQQQQQLTTSTKSPNNSTSTSVVDGNKTSNTMETTTTTATKKISQRTREENLRHFEALLAAHKASRNAGNANATGTRVVHVTPRPNVAPVLNNNNSSNNNNNSSRNNKVIAPLTTTSTSTATTTPQQQVIKSNIVSPSSAHWTPPLVIGNRNNNRLTVNNSNNNQNSNNNNMPQVIKKKKSVKTTIIIKDKMQL